MHMVDAEIDAVSDELLAAMLDESEVLAGVVQLEGEDYRYVFANRNLAQFYGLEPRDIIGRTTRDLGVSGGEVGRRLEVLSRCWAMNTRMVVELAFEHEGRAGWHRGTFVPIAGPVPRVGFVLVDITSRIVAERNLAVERRNLTGLLDLAELGLWEHDICADRVIWDARMREMFGIASDATINLAAHAELVHREDAPAMIAAYSAAQRGKNGGAFVVDHRIADGSRWLRSTGQVLFDDCGRPMRSLGTARDITYEADARERERRLLGELNHRVKNNLATVQSMAMQTARAATDLPRFLDAFQGRLVTLARIHDVLTTNTWASARLEELVCQELHAFGEQVNCRGPDVDLSAKQALAVGLVVHELATNAAKYGALSSAIGCVDVRWMRESENVSLKWRERGGPRVEGCRSSGFGTRLILALSKGDLRGGAILDLRPEGAEFALTFPLTNADCDEMCGIGSGPLSSPSSRAACRVTGPEPLGVG